MNVIVACEESGVVRHEFEKRGHKVLSCDLLPTRIEGPHYRGDVFDVADYPWDLAILRPTNIVTGRAPRIHRMAPSPERARLRSTTYTGIARAMAEQWGTALEIVRMREGELRASEKAKYEAARALVNELEHSA